MSGEVKLLNNTPIRKSYVDGGVVKDNPLETAESAAVTLGNEEPILNDIGKPDPFATCLHGDLTLEDLYLDKGEKFGHNTGGRTPVRIKARNLQKFQELQALEKELDDDKLTKQKASKIPTQAEILAKVVDEQLDTQAIDKKDKVVEIKNSIPVVEEKQNPKEEQAEELGSKDLGMKMLGLNGTSKTNQEKIKVADGLLKKTWGIGVDTLKESFGFIKPTTAVILVIVALLTSNYDLLPGGFEEKDINKYTSKLREMIGSDKTMDEIITELNIKLVEAKSLPKNEQRVRAELAILDRFPDFLKKQGINFTQDFSKPMTSVYENGKLVELARYSKEQGVIVAKPVWVQGEMVSINIGTQGREVFEQLIGFKKRDRGLKVFETPIAPKVKQKKVKKEQSINGTNPKINKQDFKVQQRNQSYKAQSVNHR